MRWWVLGQFGSGDEALAAVHALKRAGFSQLDAYSPFPVDGMSDALSLRRSWIRIPTLVVGVCAAGFAYWIQWYTNAVSYPINVGDRPLNAWPTSIPDTYETLILFSSLTVFLMFLIAAGLTRLHHPVFHVPEFDSVSINSFWVSATVHFDGARDEALSQLEKLGALRVASVPETNEEDALEEKREEHAQLLQLIAEENKKRQSEALAMEKQEEDSE